MTDRAALLAELEEKKAALKKMLTGGHVEELRYAAGAAQRSVRYSAPNMAALKIDIANLESRLGIASPRRAVRATF